MAIAPGDESRAATGPGLDVRLESWKEIAAYLHRDVTTVQRWEKHERLPVHRLQHHKLGSVYALTSEIDRWRSARTSHRASRARRWAAVSSGAVLLVGTLIKSDALVSRIGHPRHGAANDGWSESAAIDLRPLANDYGDEAEPALSPDGNYVAYVWDKANSQQQYDLFVKQVSGGDPVRIAVCPLPQDCYSPAWSPDGQRLAFLRRAPREPPGGRGSVFLVPTLGGPERRVGTVLAAGDGLSWFPDGRTIALSSRPGENEPRRIVLLSVETGTLQSFSDPPQDSFDSHPAVSPDGRTVAFLRTAIDWPYSTLLVQAVTASRPTQLNLAGREIGDVGWLPDSSALLVSSAGSLLRVPIDGGSAAHVPVDARLGRLSISRMRDRVAAVSVSTKRDIYRVSGPAAAAPVRPQRAAISSTLDESRPLYSPDGRHLAFVTKRSGSAEIWMCDVDETRCGPLPVPERFAREDRPAWSPDGNSIVFEAALPGQKVAAFYVFDLVTRTVRMLANCPPNSRNAVWALDGTHIYFSPDDTLQAGVWIASTNGREPAHKIADDRGSVPVAEHVGFLYLTRFRAPGGQGEGLSATMWRLSLVNGRTEQVPGVVWGRYAMWNGRIVAIEQHDADAASSLVLLDPVTHARRVLAELDPFSSQPTVSADGKWVMYTRVVPDRDLLLLDLKH